MRRKGKADLIALIVRELSYLTATVAILGFILMGTLGVGKILTMSGMPRNQVVWVSIICVSSLVLAVFMGTANMSISRVIAQSFAYIILELWVWLAVLILAIAVMTFLAVPSAIALNISVAVFAFLFIVSVISYRQSQGNHRQESRSSLPVNRDIKLASWIARTLTKKASQDWEEYQDWLHDILLARRESLAHGHPSWQVTIITYWRLTGLCLTIAVMKVRRWAIAARKLR